MFPRRIRALAFAAMMTMAWMPLGGGSATTLPESAISSGSPHLYLEIALPGSDAAIESYALTNGIPAKRPDRVRMIPNSYYGFGLALSAAGGMFVLEPGGSLAQFIAHYSPFARGARAERQIRVAEDWALTSGGTDYLYVAAATVGSGSIGGTVSILHVTGEGVRRLGSFLIDNNRDVLPGAMALDAAGNLYVLFGAGPKLTRRVVSVFATPLGKPTQARRFCLPPATPYSRALAVDAAQETFVGGRDDGTIEVYAASAAGCPVTPVRTIRSSGVELGKISSLAIVGGYLYAIGSTNGAVNLYTLDPSKGTQQPLSTVTLNGSAAISLQPGP
jgi:hypothetical protein